MELNEAEGEQFAVKLNDVSMCFNMCSEKINSFKEYLIKIVKRQLSYKKHMALSNVSLEIKKGDVFGVVGLNGSGKSTLLKIISGILKPTQGQVLTVGAIAPLIELGAGFDMELTARENIYLNGAVLGYSKKFICEKFDEIVEFSEMADFLDVPMKNYSSGMVARVAFSVATIVKPDILIVDEILAVGDFQFQKKCTMRIKSMMASGVTVILVSHNIEQIEKLCKHVAWLDKGRIRMVGKVGEVCKQYKNS